MLGQMQYFMDAKDTDRPTGADTEVEAGQRKIVKMQSQEAKQRVERHSRGSMW